MNINAVILARLAAIEARENVKILYACESGSRAWGFASPDSDYDVRFIYVRPMAHYLRVDLEKQRDVIEEAITKEPDGSELDINGWDLRKALQLLAKNNPVLLEWLQSNIIYINKNDFKNKLWEVAKSASALTCANHYWSMARRNSNEVLNKDEVRMKKYLYVLRPLFAVEWLEKYRTIPPLVFEILLNHSLPDGELRAVIDELIVQKKLGGERGKISPILRLNQFITEKLSYLKKHGLTVENNHIVQTDIQQFFMQILNESNMQ